jgi:hypothetical protein
MIVPCNHRCGLVVDTGTTIGGGSATNSQILIDAGPCPCGGRFEIPGEPNGTVLFDSEGRITRIRRGVSRILGELDDPVGTARALIHDFEAYRDALQAGVHIGLDQALAVPRGDAVTPPEEARARVGLLDLLRGQGWDTLTLDEQVKVVGLLLQVLAAVAGVTLWLLAGQTLSDKGRTDLSQRPEQRRDQSEVIVHPDRPGDEDGRAEEEHRVNPRRQRRSWLPGRGPIVYLVTRHEVLAIAQAVGGIEELANLSGLPPETIYDVAQVGVSDVRVARAILAFEPRRRARLL